MVPPRMIRSYDILPPLVRKQGAVQKLALSALFSRCFDYRPTCLIALLYFRDEVKAVDMVSSIGPMWPPRNTTTNCRTAWRFQPARCAAGSPAAFQQSGPGRRGKNRPDADSRSPTEF